MDLVRADGPRLVHRGRLTVAGTGQDVATGLGLACRRVVSLGPVIVSMVTAVVVVTVGIVPFLGQVQVPRGGVTSIIGPDGAGSPTLLSLLSGLLRLDAGTVTGAQRRRASVAMVLCQETDYVPLDEPLDDLDMDTRSP